MATAKKSSTKPSAKSTATKSSAAKKAPVKKNTATKATAAKALVKKAPAKRPAVKTGSKTANTRVSAKSSAAKQAEMRSFRVAHEHHNFTRFQITKQTVYWIILVAFIVFVQLWILKLQVEVVTLLDAQQAQLSEQI